MMNITCICFSETSWILGRCGILDGVLLESLVLPWLYSTYADSTPASIPKSYSSLLPFFFRIMTGTSVFNSIEITGLVGTFVVLITAVLSPSIRRLSTWYLLLCSGAMYSFSMLLLTMVHQQFGPEPNFELWFMPVQFGKVLQLFWTNWSESNWCSGSWLQFVHLQFRCVSLP